MKILKVKCLAPTRLDNYLTQQFPALTPGRLNKALRENKIKLNGKKQPLSTRVMAGDEIKLFILDEVLDADRRVDGPAWKNARGPAQVSIGHEVEWYREGLSLSSLQPHWLWGTEVFLFIPQIIQSPAAKQYFN